MKSIFFLLSLMFLAGTTTAQEYEYDEYENSEETEYVEEAPSLDCYQKYTQVFTERGAEQVTDGTYEDIVIVVNKGGVRECFSGKATVYQGKLVCSNVEFASDNGFVPGPQTRSIPVTIANGMSKVYTDSEGSQITVIFPKSLKAKKENLKKAPDPIIPE